MMRIPQSLITVTLFSKILAGLLFFAFIIIAFFVGMKYESNLIIDKTSLSPACPSVTPVPAKDQTVCTMEVKLCPDGKTYVGRQGPNCEFSPCPQINSLLSETEAHTIAKRLCIKSGETLADGIYNENSKTWWFDANLNTNKEGCNPACVVSEETKTAEINWRCTGLIEP